MKRRRKSIMPLPRLATLICGYVVGAYCAYTAFRNGQSLANGLDGIAFGSAFSATVIGSWFLLPLAAASPRQRRPLIRLGWSLCVAFVLVNSIGFTANHRTEKVGERFSAITAYDVSLTALKAAQERLAAMKANPRWVRTSGCTDATVEQSIAFCKTVQQVQAEILKNQPVVTSGRPALADAQADTIGWVTRIDAHVVAKAMPVFWSVALEIAASLFIWVALTTYETPQVVKRAVSRAKKRKTKRWTSRQSQQMLQTALTKPDRRKRAKNDNVPPVPAN